MARILLFDPAVISIADSAAKSVSRRTAPWLFCHGGAASALALVLAAGCGGGGADERSPGPEPDRPYEGPTAWVFDALDVGGPDTGFDLDGHTTLDRTDSVGCGRPDGANGVDNELGPLLLAFEPFLGSEGEMTQALVDAIDDGTLVLLARLVEDDGGTGFEISRDRTSRLLAWLPATITSRRLTTGEGTCFDFPLPLRPAELFGVDVHACRVASSVGEDLFEGVIGGYLSIREILDAMLASGAPAGFEPEELQALAAAVLSAAADIDVIPAGPTGESCAGELDCAPGQTCEDGGCVEPDENCDALSAALSFHASPTE